MLLPMPHFCRPGFHRSRPAYRRPAMRLALVAMAALASACADAPTFPAALQWLADGEEWVAVLPPASLPTATEWARFAGGGASGAELGRRMATMETEVAAALTRGDLAGATRLRSD